ncbi:MAG TPA: DsbE family thiol:disulfide interchange protein [Gammaproteobacteria bacterium]|jgi:cytochrome c biogenesis protein CcmG, thiol:disulfide interchange protein DsbE|nr:DsbE family thiol:disulfide interchange protein [Pseudomonadota bacterium]HAY45181.1 DsbE family thiol:disulfide interchange protein [Gammaproteobacteria bacterium]
MTQESFIQKPLFWIPLTLFIGLCILLAVGLTLNPREVPSPLIGKPAPKFALPILGNSEQVFSTTDNLGKPWVLNVWASWCIACRHEHPILNEYARNNETFIVGLNYKDPPANGQAWLDQFGDPYTLSVIDFDGRTGIDWGVYGVPETFVVDASGIIRYKHIGPITVSSLQNEIVPLLRELSLEM